MVAVKAHQAQAFLASPDQRLRAVLFYGSDAGLISERGQTFATRAAARFNPPGEILRLDDADLDGAPDRLLVELGTVPMFGGPKIVRAAAGRRVNTVALKPLIEEGGIEGLLIVEAGNLKPDDSMRLLFEKSPLAAAVACYVDAEPDLEGLVREVLGQAKLSITPEARDALVARLGADRVLSRAEVEKLALYAAGKREIEVEDVEAVVGDASELTIDRVIYAAAGGQTDRAIGECARAIAAGESAQTIILALQRHFIRLHRARAAIDGGTSIETYVKSMRPPLHFKIQGAFSAQCRAWTNDRLREALRRIMVAAKAARLSSALEDDLVERLLLALSMMVRDSAGAGRRR